MKLGLAITSLFAASATAATKYPPGQDCRTNKGCDENCTGGKWSVVMVAGDARMVCDPGSRDSSRYATATCEPTKYSKSFTLTTIDGFTKAACDVIKGKICESSCYVTVKASAEEDLTERFSRECTTQADNKNTDVRFSGKFLIYPSKEETVEFTDCKTSIFS